MPDNNRALIGRILLLSAAFLGVLALIMWAGAFTVDARMREVFTVGLALCAVAEALIGLFFLLRS